MNTEKLISNLEELTKQYRLLLELVPSGLLFVESDPKAVPASELLAELESLDLAEVFGSCSVLVSKLLLTVSSDC